MAQSMSTTQPWDFGLLRLVVSLNALHALFHPIAHGYLSIFAGNLGLISPVMTLSAVCKMAKTKARRLYVQAGLLGSLKMTNTGFCNSHRAV